MTKIICKIQKKTEFPFEIKDLRNCFLKSKTWIVFWIYMVDDRECIDTYVALTIGHNGLSYNSWNDPNNFALECEIRNFINSQNWEIDKITREDFIWFLEANKNFISPLLIK